MADLPRVECIFCDVDGTLIIDGKLNRALVLWLEERNGKGYEVNLWSAAGRQHAVDIARKHGIEDLFDSITSKPGYVVDDLGWGWTKYARVVRGFV